MSDSPSLPETETLPERPAESRTLRWLLGGQIALAVLLVIIDLGPSLPGLFAPGSNSPEINQPIRPGDQTRRYRPDAPSNPGPGVDPNMPRRLTTAALEEDGQTGIALTGAISPGDGSRIVSELRLQAPAFITLHSPGGSVSDALAIGRAVRDLNIETRIQDGAVCLSACPYIFVGGIKRSMSEDARLGVHQHSFGESTILPAFLATQDIQSGQAEVLEHLDQMGIDLRIMGPALATPANEIYILTKTELTDWKVISE